MPLANSLLKKEQLNSPEPLFPLDVYFCNECGLVQLTYVVPPEILFKNYVYVTGISDTMREHFAQFAKEIVENFNLSSDSLIVDIGGNDGTFLKEFKRFNVKTLNVEPATNIAKLSEESGIETVNDFWSDETAVRIKKEMGPAKVILGTNVFAHVNDLDGFLRGVNSLLDDGGIFVIEVPYLGDLIKNREFDTIYHEHLSYFAISPLMTLFKKFNMEIFDIKRVGVHGGSIRVYVGRVSKSLKVSESVPNLLEVEKGLKLNSLDTYIKFATEIKEMKDKLLEILRKLRSEGKKIVGYGAPAKGTVLLNYFGISADILDYTVDRTTLKQGLYVPGVRIPIFPPEKLLEDKPDYVLILVWNIADEIMKQQQKYKELGGRFIIPVPEIKII
jgi:hypothetical protein